MRAAQTAFVRKKNTKKNIRTPEIWEGVPENNPLALWVLFTGADAVVMQA